jgi:chromosome segregation ATPase
MIWVIVTLILVLIAKYYTAISVKHLEARLNEAKEGIEEARARLKVAKDRQDGAKEQEKNLKFRVERLQALIQDMETDIRMPRRAEEEYEEVTR